MRTLFSFLDTIIAKALYLFLDVVGYIMYLFLLLKHKITGKKNHVDMDLDKYLNPNNLNSSTSTISVDKEPKGFDLNAAYGRPPLSPYNPPEHTKLPMLEFDEEQEFERIKKYLTNKAKELGGTMNWYNSPDGLCVYTFDFKDDASFKKFEDIIINTATFGLPVFEEETKVIDDDINDLLSEIENNNGNK